MKITYYVDNGYAGSRGCPYHVDVDNEDLEFCSTEEEKYFLILERVQEDYNQKIHFYWDTPEEK